MAATQASQISQVSSNVGEWNAYKVFDGQSTDETTSVEIDVSNAQAVTMFIETGVGVSGGVVKLEFGMTTGGPFVIVGSVTTSAASTGYGNTQGMQQNGFTTGALGLPVRYARLRIETAISGGTVDAWIVVQS